MCRIKGTQRWRRNYSSLKGSWAFVNCRPRNTVWIDSYLMTKRFMCWRISGLSQFSHHFAQFKLTQHIFRHSQTFSLLAPLVFLISFLAGFKTHTCLSSLQRSYSSLWPPVYLHVGQELTDLSCLYKISISLQQHPLSFYYIFLNDISCTFWP